jgi:hypothetical protein
MEWKNDPYRQACGGSARLFAVHCATCGTHLFSYQKDGPGIVKRLYLDRIYQSQAYAGVEHRALQDVPQLLCPQCGGASRHSHNIRERTMVGFRLFAGVVTTKVRRRSSR